MEITVARPEDLIACLKSILESDDDSFSILFSDTLDFKIKITGDTWDGMIDSRIAKHVIELERVLNRFAKSDGDESAKPLVKVEIKPGCTELIEKIPEFLSDFCKDMESKHKAIVAVAFLAAAFGVYSVPQIKEAVASHYAAQTAQSHDAAEVQKFTAMKDQAIGVIDSLNKKYTPETPVRGIVGSLNEADTLQLPGKPEATKEVAKTIYPRSHKKAETVQIDDVFEITDVSVATGVYRLSRGSDSFSAELSVARFTPAQRTAFYDELRQAVEALTPLRIELQVDAKAGNGKIREAVIVGIKNGIRPGSVSIDSALRD